MKYGIYFLLSLFMFGGLLFASSTLHAQVVCTGGQDGGNTQNCAHGALQNPIGVDTINDFVKKVLDIVLTIAIPIVALFIVYSGFLFVTARGNEEKLKAAKKTFLYTVIGAAIVLGAWTLAQALQDTVTEIQTNS